MVLSARWMYTEVNAQPTAIADITRRQIDVVDVAAKMARQSNAEGAFASTRRSMEQVATAIGNSTISKELTTVLRSV